MKLMKRLCGLFAAMLCATTAVAADPYPSKPVMLLVPYPAGGLSDGVARLFNGPLGAKLGQPVLVENLGGASGILGAKKVLGAPADGYYLFQGTPNEVILSPLANASAKFKTEDFRMVQLVAHSPIGIIARKDLPANSVDEFIALAQKSSANGTPLTYGSVGIGSLYHLLSEHFAKRIGVKLTHVPYKGGAPLMQDLGGGQIDFAIVAYGPATVAMAEQGRLKILASVGGTPPEGVKNLPSVSQSKQLKDFEFTIWSGYLVKKGTPEEVVQRLEKAITETLQDPHVRSRLEAQGATVAKPMSLEESTKYFESEAARYRALAKSIGLQPQ